MVRSGWRGNYAGNPTDLLEGDQWFDTVTKQFKGYTGTTVVLLG